MATRRGTVLRVALAVVVVAAVAATSTWWCRSPAQPSPAVDGLERRTAPTDTDTVVVEPRPARRTGAVRREPPTAVRLPDGAVVPVRAVSSRTDGVLDVPADVDQAGWWRGGSALGDPFGSTLLAAHVDSRTQGLGPFAGLLDVRRGDRFEVASTRLRQSFVTTSVRLLERTTALRRRWLYDSSGARRLVLVTCAPPYVPERDGYQRLAVVTAVPASPPRLGKR